MIRTMWTGGEPYYESILLLSIATLLVPAALVAGTVHVLCLIECTSLPWLTVLLVPLLLIVVALPLIVLFAVGDYRSASQFPAPRRKIGKAAALVIPVLAPIPLIALLV